jgi:phosphate-selective porin OprO/OprP
MTVRAALVAAVWSASPAWAQSAPSSAGSATAGPAQATAAPSGSPEAPAQGAATRLPAQRSTAGWQDAFALQTASGDYRLVLGLTAQTDGKFSLDDPTPIVNTFTIRRARPTLTGRVAKYFDFKVMPDFGNGTATVLDAYFDIRFSTRLRVRSGKDKSPIGYELLIGDGYLLFPERALASSLVPNRDVGVQAQGDFAGGTVSYSGGVFNGIPDGTSATTDVDTHNANDVAGRLVLRPFRSTKTSSSPLNGLGFQIGGSHGREIGVLPSFKTSIGQTYFSYASTVTASGIHHRVTPAVFYYYKSFGAFGEYIRSQQQVVKANADTDVDNRAWEITGSVVLTGEAASDRGVRPKNSFDPAAGQWGALQIVARYAKLTVDPLAFASSLAAANSSPEARSFSIGVNWYPAACIKYYLTFERTSFGAVATGTARPNENVILFRTQLSF